MTFYVENEVEVDFGFDILKQIELVALKTIELEHCPYEVQINVVITDNPGIRTYNKDYRDIDKETDVLSFPGVFYDKPADFSIAESDPMSYFDPETDELLLGDIILSSDRVISQAKDYGHSIKREFSFLIAHSMLHLLGYDHMTEMDERDMFARQELILSALHITREKSEE